jgi:hypothetical protein
MRGGEHQADGEVGHIVRENPGSVGHQDMAVVRGNRKRVSRLFLEVLDGILLR